MKIINSIKEEEKAATTSVSNNMEQFKGEDNELQAGIELKVEAERRLVCSPIQTEVSLDYRFDPAATNGNKCRLYDSYSDNNHHIIRRATKRATRTPSSSSISKSTSPLSSLPLTKFIIFPSKTSSNHHPRRHQKRIYFKQSIMSQSLVSMVLLALVALSALEIFQLQHQLQPLVSCTEVAASTQISHQKPAEGLRQNTQQHPSLQYAPTGGHALQATNDVIQSQDHAANSSSNNRLLIQQRLSRPLALPQPPPTESAVKSSSTGAIGNTNARQKRRSLVDSSELNDLEGGSHVTAAEKSAHSDAAAMKQRQQRRQSHLLALTWQEAKRVLLMSAMPSALTRTLEHRQQMANQNLAQKYQQQVDDLRSSATTVLPSTTPIRTTASTGPTTTSTATTTTTPDLVAAAARLARRSNENSSTTQTALTRLEQQPVNQDKSSPLATAATTRNGEQQQARGRRVVSVLGLRDDSSPQDFAVSPTTTTSKITPTNQEPPPRRQRHNSQQLSARSSPADNLNVDQLLHQEQEQQLQYQQATFESLALRRIKPPDMGAAPGLLSDNRIQEMAAAMLPFVWPSFQLAATSGALATARKQQQRSELSQMQPPVSVTGNGSSANNSQRSQWDKIVDWPMEYKQVTRINGSNQYSPMAASDFTPTIVSLDSQPPVDQSTVTTAAATTTPTASSPTITTSTSTMTTTTPMPSLVMPPQLTSRDRKKQAASVHKQMGGRAQGRSSGENRSQRKRRRKPTYLAAAGNSLSISNDQLVMPTPQSQTSPYPDSTRLASKYLMPRIKFQNGQQTTVAPTTVSPQMSFSSLQMSISDKSPASNGPAPIVSSRQENQDFNKWQPLAKVVPKSLSRLIEQQLLLNATSILADWNRRMKSNDSSKVLAAPYLAGLAMATNLSTRLAPTTSVTKVVRLRNDTDLQILMTSGGFSPIATTTTTTVRPQKLTAMPANARDFGREFGRSVGTEAPIVVTTTTKQPTTTTFAPTTAPSVGRSNGSQMQQQQQQKQQAVAVTTTTTTSESPTTTSERPKIRNPMARTESRTTESSEMKRHLLEAPTTTQTAVTTSTMDPTTTAAIATSPAATGASSSDGQQVQSLKQQQKIRQQTSGTLKPSGSKPKKFGHHQEHEQSVLVNGGQSGNNQTAISSSKEQQLQALAGQLNQSGDGKNIKLFHFKRKPDVAKLPFYKKPLNYTELGWTNEQIQEHLESLGLPSVDVSNEESSSGNGGSTSGRPQNQSDEEDHEDEEESKREASAGESKDKSQASNSLGVGSSSPARAELLLLKRKRRGKNQFERLMAELHGTSLPTTESSATTPTTATPTTGGEHLVPVMVGKKAEPYVLKPMFSVMNQKKRRDQWQKNGAGAVRGPLMSNRGAETQTTNTTPPPPTTLTESTNRNATGNRANGKPIIRLRRKHHGEQPQPPSQPPVDVAFLMSSEHQNRQQHHRSVLETQWSRPLGSMDSKTQAAPSLMLVPSGLLTPSGSHLMPLYAPTNALLQRPTAPSVIRPQQQHGSSKADEQSKFVNDLFAWRPSSGQTNAASGTQSAGWRPGAPADATSGERLMVFASAPNPKLTTGSSESQQQEPQENQQQHQQQQQSQQQKPVKELQVASLMQSMSPLRVPKLLVKPMRPAKYSLNGYIPKPSLAQQLQAQQQLHQHQQQTQLATATAAATASSGSNGQAGNQFARQTLLRAKQRTIATANGMSAANAASPWQTQSSSSSAATQPQSTNNKDLDSSTTNEIFSRRRGLQQHLRYDSVSKKPLSFAGLLLSGNATSSGSLNSNNNPLPPVAVSQTKIQRQMEENKRKYVLQQQDSMRSPILSVQRVNQIKAKLGLLTGSRSTNSSSKNNQQQSAAQASTNSITVADPTQDTDEPSDSVAKQMALIGAPLNSIPKTDFECTDKRGKFVSGLFADFKTGCQVWHLCSNNRKYSFLCPTGTIFNAKVRICDWRYNVKCENTLPF